MQSDRQTELKKVMAEVLRLCSEGDELVTSGRFDEAVNSYSAAWEMTPAPKHDSNWILFAIGDAYFRGGHGTLARRAFENSMSRPNEVGHPFLHLRLGQVLLDAGEEDAAVENLMRAYVHQGAKCFAEEDPKYLKFLESRADLTAVVEKRTPFVLEAGAPVVSIVQRGQGNCASEFLEFWSGFYPDSQPLAYLMRAARTRYWVRFHSLPLSKQHAETDDEYSIILGKQHELAHAVLGENHPCWLVQACWPTADGVIEVSDELEMFRVTREFGLKHAVTLHIEGDDEGNDWNVMVAPVRWTRGGFDDVLLRIADDEEAPVLWVSAEHGAVFAPYDGGVDLFLPSETMVEELRSTHLDWLSSHPRGL